MKKKKLSTIVTYETNWKLYSKVEDEWDRLRCSPMIKSCFKTTTGLLQFRFEGYSGWLQITPKQNNVNIHYKEGEERPEQMLKSFLQILAPKAYWFLPKRIPVEGEIEFQRRKIHTDDLKEKVIKPWLSRLDKAVPEILPVKNVIVISRESAMDQVLFEDLRLHVDPEVFDFQTELDDKIVKVEEKKGELLDFIDENILTVFKDLGLGFSNRWVGDCVHRNLSRLIFEAAYYWETDRKYYEEEYRNYFIGKMDKDGYWSKNGVGYIKFIKTIKKKVINKKMRTLRLTVENLVFSKDMKLIIDIHKGALNLRDEVKLLLQEYLNRITFPGYCKYISG